MPSRRDFLQTVGATSALALAGVARIRLQPRTFAGSHPGETRIVEGIRLSWCPPGRFVMGSPPDQAGHRPDEAQVNVTLTRGFWMGTFEVTQGEWRRVIGTGLDREPTPQFGVGDDMPVYWVNFSACETFCSKVTELARRSGAMPADWEFRLPTEAQWEYACRAGTTTAFAFGDGLGRDQANFKAAAVGLATKVGSYPPNAWGIHDMHGNIFEWCRDWYHARLPGGADPDLSAVRGVPNRDGTYSRVRRGGAWNDDAWACRSALRLRYEPERSSDHIGVRIIVARTPSQ